MLLKVMQLLEMRCLFNAVIVIPSQRSHMLHYGCSLFSLSFLGKSMPCHKKVFYISPSRSIAYSSPVTGYCYQGVLTLFITSLLPAPTIHLILFWLFLCFDLRTACSKTALLRKAPRSRAKGVISLFTGLYRALHSALGNTSLPANPQLAGKTLWHKHN